MCVCVLVDKGQEQQADVKPVLYFKLLQVLQSFLLIQGFGCLSKKENGAPKPSKRPLAAQACLVSLATPPLHTAAY